MNGNPRAILRVNRVLRSTWVKRCVCVRVCVSACASMQYNGWTRQCQARAHMYLYVSICLELCMSGRVGVWACADVLVCRCVGVCVQVSSRLCTDLVYGEVDMTWQQDDVVVGVTLCVGGWGGVGGCPI